MELAIEAFKQGGFALVNIVILLFILRYFMRVVDGYREALKKREEEFESMIRIHYATINENMEKIHKSLEAVADRLEALCRHAGV